MRTTSRNEQKKAYEQYAVNVSKHEFVTPGSHITVKEPATASDRSPASSNFIWKHKSIMLRYSMLLEKSSWVSHEFFLFISMECEETIKAIINEISKKRKKLAEKSFILREAVSQHGLNESTAENTLEEMVKSGSLSLQKSNITSKMQIKRVVPIGLLNLL